MPNGEQELKSRRVELFEERGETSRFTHAEIDDSGNFIMSTIDIGKAPEETWGDSDYEFWVTVPKEQKDMLLLALIEKVYGGVFSAVDEFRKFLEDKKIPSRFQNWS